MSDDGLRTCVWTIDQEGNGGEVISALDCDGADDCPGTFFCAAATEQWTPQSQICPNDVANAAPDPAGAARIYVTSNDGLPNEVRVLTRAAPVAGAQNPPYVLDETFLHNSRENQGAAVDASGNLLHVGDGLGQGFDAMGQMDDTVNAPGLITACQIDLRGMAGDGDAYDADLDHQLRGEFNNAALPPEFENDPGMASPKGMLIHQPLGLAFVADFGNATVRAYGLAASGNNAAIATIATPGNPWDLAYDAARDILYVALTSGSVARYNNAGAILRGGGTPPLTGLIGIVDAGGTSISSNLHGIEYVPGSDGNLDALVVSDVGAATTMEDGASFNSDGSLYLMLNISETTNGNVQPDRIVRGASTQLGNPVDLVVSGRDLVVAEKANDMVLFFNDFFTEEGENVSPSASIDITRPESLAFQPVFGLDRPAVTDFATATLPTISKLFVSRAVDGTITVERRDLSGSLEVAYEIDGAGLTSQNVLAGLNGEALVTTLDESDMFNGPEGGVLNINAFTTRTVNPDFQPTRDRRHSGNGLTGPRGFDIAPAFGVLFVADFAAGNIKVISACGDGTVLDTLNVANVTDEPIVGAPNPDPDAAPWDVDFDPLTGDLYVAMVNGNVAVFREVIGSEDSTVGDGDASNNDYDFTVDLQLIANNAAIAVGANLHGVEYVPGAGGGSLILSDVGAATMSAQPGFDTDGALYVVNNVGSLGTNGAMQQTRIVDARIAGANTLLGNPVDIAFDGANLYVAEKANAGGQILRFNNILATTGDQNIAPSAPSISAAAIESISLVPDYVISP